MGFISALCPSLPEIQADRSRGAADLSRQRPALFQRKALAELKNLHRKDIRDLIDFQFFCGLDFHYCNVGSGFSVFLLSRFPSPVLCPSPSALRPPSPHITSANVFSVLRKYQIPEPHNKTVRHAEERRADSESGLWPCSRD